jgi:hypothetical protein
MSKVSATSSSGSSNVHSAHADNVHVQSVVQSETQSKVSLENAKKITDLMARLGKFHIKLEDHKVVFVYILFKDQLIFKLMNIQENVLKKLAKLFLNQLKKLWLTHNYNNNNFLLMRIYVQLVNFIYLIRLGLF